MSESRTASSPPPSFGELNSALAGRYVVEREIGAGGMASVYLARDLKHGRLVAVKVLQPELSTSISADRFTREIQIAASLTHPHILPVHDSGAANGMLYYVMPFVEGESLAARIKRGGPLGLSEARKTLREVGEALQYAHDRGVVHRDIKPGNILLSAGVAVVADFGLARAIEGESGGERLTTAGVGLGTPVYMSPEQAMGASDVDHRSDQYSLACVLFEMLTGKPPFLGNSFKQLLAQHVMEAAPRVSKSRTDAPVAVERALERALSKLADDRFANVAEFVAAVEGERLSAGTSGFWTSRRVQQGVSLVGAGAALWLAAAIGTGLWGGRSADVTVDENRLVVAPFEVFSPSLQLWREGLVDILSRDFDGAGPLRTVAPSLVMRTFTGKADRTTGAALARTTGAGLAVVGQLEAAGSDSVRATVLLVDAVRGDSVIGETEVRDEVSRMDRVADSIAVRLLRALGERRSIAAVPRTFFGSRSLPALKAFLQGEQHYRRNDFAAARPEYERALALDSTFVMAARRMRGVLRGLGVGEMDSASLSYAIRAGNRNRGLAPRDSLLIVADSLTAAHRYPPTFADSMWMVQVRRRFAALDAAAARYPEDPEVWTELGEARMHFGERVGIDDERALQAFERALAMDSVYGPAFFHYIDLGLVLREDRALAPVVDRYLRFNPGDVRFQLLAQVLRGASVAQLRRTINDLPPDQRNWRLLTMLRRRLDSRDLFDSLHVALLRNHSPTRGDSASNHTALRLRRLYRGRIRAAREFVDSGFFQLRPYWLLSAVGLLTSAGVIEKTEVSATLDDFLREVDVNRLPFVLSWWGERRDTNALARVAASSKTLADTATGQTRLAAQYVMALANAHLALALGDSVSALREFLSVRDSTVSANSLPVRLEVVRLMVAMRRDRDARDYLDRRPPHPEVYSIWEVLWHHERAAVAERLGDRAGAQRHYRFVLDAWDGADRELQPAVSTARAALRQLGETREAPRGHLLAPSIRLGYVRPPLTHLAVVAHPNARSTNDVPDR